MAQTLSWNTNVQDIPFDKPVLARKRGEPVPFMAVRDCEYEPESVSYLLGPTASAYGIYVDIEELEGWTDVM